MIFLLSFLWGLFGFFLLLVAQGAASGDRGLLVNPGFYGPPGTLIQVAAWVTIWPLLLLLDPRLRRELAAIWVVVKTDGLWGRPPEMFSCWWR